MSLNHKKIFWVGLLFILLSYFLFTIPKNPSFFDHTYDTKQKDIIPKPEDKALSFLIKKMSGPEFSIYTNYTNEESHNKIIPTGKDILSESQGLFLLYLFNRNNQNDFDTCLKWTHNHLYLDEGIFSWVQRKSSQKEHVNALIDDMRILRSIILASEKWGDSYLPYAKCISKSILTYNAKGNDLIDFYDIHNKSKGNILTLSYIDLYTMKKSISLHSKWKDFYDTSYEILTKGKMNNTGLYQYQYNIHEKKYMTPDSISLIQSVYSMLHLAEAGSIDKEGINWLWKEYKKYGVLYADYSSISLQPISQTESTALYALTARLFHLAGKNNQSQIFLKECEKFQVKDHNSPICGSFGNPKNNQVYSFDNLQYLLSSSTIYKNATKE
ncbi:glycosyl hydrolase family 8 [Inediibacterium massiliense]|uniref:glycosyl hydrolase family 8 n=1 Tax=Inediibacterium massiliense TaxID=1658111 RepID=UPI0006B4D219|nr:glycosyl hydrolase family 8 [Inediibacterium massiliense]